MGDTRSAANRVVTQLEKSSSNWFPGVREDVVGLVKREIDKAVYETLCRCRGIIGSHKRYWEDADAEVAELQRDLETAVHGVSKDE